MFTDWNWTLLAVSVSFHSTAILSTALRLWYRWHTARIWWDDACAILALLADIAFLVVTVLQQPISQNDLPRFYTVGNWITSFAYPTLMCAARTSILISMVRLSHPEGKLRYIALGVGVCIAIIALVMLGQRIQICLTRNCLVTRTLIISQITTDCIANVLLSALPIWFLRKMNLKRGRRMLVSSAFSACIFINVVVVVQAVALSGSITSGSIIFEHVKVACMMIVCNLLVIVTFVYRTLYKGKQGLDDSLSETNMVKFTTVDLALSGPSQESNEGKSLNALSGTANSSTWSAESDGRTRTSASGSVAMSRIDTV